MREGFFPSLKTTKMKIIPIIFMLSLLSICSFSKDKIVTEYQYSLSGLGFGQQKVSFLSPIFYNASSLVSSRGNVKATKNRISIFDTETDIGINYNKAGSTFYSFDFDLSYSKYYLLKIKDYPASFPDLYAGWGYWLNTDFYIKPDNTNNPFYYNFNNLVCFGIYCEKKIQKVKISNEFRLSIFGIFSGSEYSSGLPYFLTEEDASFFQAFDIGSFKTDCRGSNKLNVDFRMNTKKKVRTFRLQYEINSSVLSLNGNIKHNTFHIFKIGYLYNLSNYEHP